MKYFIRARRIELRADADASIAWQSNKLDVVLEQDLNVEAPPCARPFYSMCASILADIGVPSGYESEALAEIRAIESGETRYIEADGNAFITFITPHEVWFQNLYIDIDESPVSFRQYKLAVETWVKFLADPERKPIVVPFPDDVLDRATLPPRPPRNEE